MRDREQELLDQDANQSMVSSFARTNTRGLNRMGTIIGNITGRSVGECMLCMTDMQDGEKVITLNCWPDHQFHEKCYQGMVEHFERTSTPLLCPLCRTPIEKDKTIKKLLKSDAPENMKHEDAFDLNDRLDSDPKIN